MFLILCDSNNDIYFLTTHFNLLPKKKHYLLSKHFWTKAKNLEKFKIAGKFYGFPLDCTLGEVPRLRITCGDLFGDFNISVPFSLSGDGELPPPEAEFLRDDPILTSK